MSRNQFVAVLNIPKNTTIEKIILSGDALSGILKKLIINIPQGWQFSAGIKIKWGNKIQMPSPQWKSGDDYYTGENIPLTFEPNIDVSELVPIFWGINNDALNDHTCVVTLELEQ